MNREPIILVGGGGHCTSCIDVIESEGKYSIKGILDVKEKTGQKLLGYEFIGTDADIRSLVMEFKNFLITVGQMGQSTVRNNLFNLLETSGAVLPTIISPEAYVSPHSVIGKGTIVMHHSLINAGVKIGVNCIINSKSLIEHDAVIEDNCHISTASVVNGGVRVGAGTFFGSGAISKQGVVIPENAFIKANSTYKG